MAANTSRGLLQPWTGRKGGQALRERVGRGGLTVERREAIFVWSHQRPGGSKGLCAIGSSAVETTANDQVRSSRGQEFCHKSQFTPLLCGTWEVKRGRGERPGRLVTCAPGPGVSPASSTSVAVNFHFVAGEKSPPVGSHGGESWVDCCPRGRQCNNFARWVACSLCASRHSPSKSDECLGKSTGICRRQPHSAQPMRYEL